MTEVEDNFRTEAVLKPSPPRTPVSVKSAGRWFPCQSPCRPIFQENHLQAVRIPSPTMSRPAFECHRLVTKSLALVVVDSAKASQPLPSEGNPHFNSPEAAGKDPEMEGGRHSDHPRPPDPPTFWLSPGGFFGWA